jgi:hypothetical protein
MRRDRRGDCVPPSRIGQDNVGGQQGERAREEMVYLRWGLSYNCA